MAGITQALGALVVVVTLARQGAQTLVVAVVVTLTQPPVNLAVPV